MNTLISICPTRNRPQLAKRMFDSWLSTRTLASKLVLYVADNDPSLEEYKRIFSHTDMLDFIVGPQMTVIDVFNAGCTKWYPDALYYQACNDDHVYRTAAWDRKLIQSIEDKGGWGIACPWDKLDADWYTNQHPSAEVISSNIIRTLGHYFLPKLKHLGADEYLKEVGLGINRLWLVRDVVIEHMHVVCGKAPEDDNYRAVYSAASARYRYEVLMQWRMSGQKDAEIKKLNAAIASVKEGVMV